ncbi:hypothetical protein IP69_14625 [Bosea sp. AAP35]|uniref:exopolysaccharide Pel transporter PelG n=1 Tax=Bosea sp. AAP35 TaxID=1523417 RepID=UPI0006B91130|nr:exopolysaccharide Pel transporter PelG [Bosea sp. AAP35]KPF66545.1 hypothetical protein IP69_14625 [Bosea sp. AAP35]
MAGIGFELKKLAKRRGMLAPAASLGHATVVAAGPWLLTVIAMSLIQSRVTLESEWRHDSVQALIIYCFCVSLVATAPITAVAVRVASDKIYLRQFETLAPVFLITTLISVVSGLAVAMIVFSWLFKIAAEELLFATLSCGIVSAMWPAMAFCGMIRRYGEITRAFVFGLAASVALTFAAEQLAFSAAVEGLLFASGLGLTTILLQAVFLTTFSAASDHQEGRDSCPPHLRPNYAMVALGALLSALGLWADTWVMWFGSLQVLSPEGLATAPFYDSVMFMARISMVPALAFFVIWVETAVFDRVLSYIATIRGTGTLERIWKEAAALHITIRQMLTSVILVQLLASTALALLAHVAIDASGLLFQQTGLLRNGAIGALFHVVFIAATSILLFLDRVRAFTCLQALFLVLNGSLTLVVTAWLPEAYGIGYLLAAALSAVAAVVVLEDTSENIVSVTFAEAHRQATTRKGRPRIFAALEAMMARYKQLAAARALSPHSNSPISSPSTVPIRRPYDPSKGDHS